MDAPGTNRLRAAVAAAVMILLSAAMAVMLPDRSVEPFDDPRWRWLYLAAIVSLTVAGVGLLLYALLARRKE